MTAGKDKDLQGGVVVTVIKSSIERRHCDQQRASLCSTQQCSATFVSAGITVHGKARWPTDVEHGVTCTYTCGLSEMSRFLTSFLRFVWHFFRCHKRRQTCDPNFNSFHSIGGDWYLCRVHLTPRKYFRAQLSHGFYWFIAFIIFQHRNPSGSEYKATFENVSIDLTGQTVRESTLYCLASHKNLPRYLSSVFTQVCLSV